MKNILIVFKMLVLTLIFGLTVNKVNAQQPIYVGFRVPQMTEVDRLLIGAEIFPEHARGQLIKNLETNTLQYWNGKEWICLNSKEAILEYVVNNFNQTLGGTILNFLTHNLTEEFVDSVMVKVTIDGETGIIVESSGTRHITVKLPEGLDIGDLLVWDSTEWQPKTPDPVWFYMPSIVIDVSQDRTDTIINLYDEYLRQFHVDAPGSRIVGSGPSINTIVRVYERDQLHFYVIGYDNTVFTIHEITEEGEMRFDINAANVSEETFMNIIFVVR